MFWDAVLGLPAGGVERLDRVDISVKLIIF